MKNTQGKAVIQVDDIGDNLIVFCPWTPRVPGSMKSIGGKWKRERKYWLIPSKHRENLRREILFEFGYDIDGTPSVENNQIYYAIHVGSFGRNELPFWFCGTRVASIDRKSGPDKVTAQGVTLLSGGSVPTKDGGSVLSHDTWISVRGWTDNAAWQQSAFKGKIVTLDDYHDVVCAIGLKKVAGLRRSLDEALKKASEQLIDRDYVVATFNAALSDAYQDEG